MAIYFSADHLVWAYQIGLLNDKKTGERVQKVHRLRALDGGNGDCCRSCASDIIVDG